MAGQPGTFPNVWVFMKTNKYPLYALVLLMTTYMINQCDTFSLVATNNSMAQEIQYGDRVCSPVNVSALETTLRRRGENVTADEYCRIHQEECEDSNGQNTSLCYWRYLGRGLEYQLLAGPMYIVLFSISGIPMGLLSEIQGLNRKAILSVCVIVWSIMTVLGGFAQTYWHLALSRLLLGIFSAGCVPFSASIISDYFAEEQMGAALGFYNWGVYLGYSLTFVLIIVEQQLGWRYVYFIAGAPGIVIGFVIMITLRDPPRQYAHHKRALDAMASNISKLKTVARRFADPVLLLLCLGGAIRNGAGIVFAYNIRNFFTEYHPGTVIEAWMSWLPLVFGSLGAFGGGLLSDRFSTNRGPIGRLIVLISCLILSAPWQVGTLYLPMPIAFIFQIPAYVIGEMWIGVCVAVVIDLVPQDLTASAVAVYFFIIQIIGGNMNLFVTPLTRNLNLRDALLVTFPCMYIVAALIFMLPLCLLYRKPRSQYSSQTNGQRQRTDDVSHAEVSDVKPPLDGTDDRDYLAQPHLSDI